MTFTDIAEGFSESESNAFEQLLKKYSRLINHAVRKYGEDYHRHYYGSTDQDDLMQIARIALHDAFLRFDMSKVAPGKDPEHVFTRFAAKTIKGNLSDHFRKTVRHTSIEYFIIDQEKAPDFPDPRLETVEQQMYALIEDELNLLTPREQQYLTDYLIKGWKTMDIAAAEGVSEHTVRSWKKSIRKKLAGLKDRLN
ncbi:sigma-70 family RNA polymerase sigma factor [Sporolactobacillus vineae]|uniref:sigma-70 family RNA polymerase sigma factor n=1 Tax=Sporolactobacillus vineae TaxID=444463 RepID=UPI001EE6506D|nr:sigma-70 family RNA polymerase sigma factor [Sporolactobacillus vineae]